MRRHGADGLDVAVFLSHQALARGSKSFVLASKLLPASARDDAAVVYAWCRRTDDAIDKAAASQQPAELQRLRAELELVYSQAQPRDLLLMAFQDVVRRRQIPASYPRELVAGMAMDVSRTRYRTLDDLLLYCYRVASTVGLMMCHVMGLSDPRALENAAHLGIAMQLTNICRDVAEDWAMGRLYLPEELITRHGGGDSIGDLGDTLPPTAAQPLARAVRELLGEARRYYRSADAGLEALPWRCALAIRAARNIYSAIGDELANRDFDVSAGRAVVPLANKLKLIAGALGTEALNGPKRARNRLSNRDYGYPNSEITRPTDVLFI